MGIFWSTPEPVKETVPERYSYSSYPTDSTCSSMRTSQMEVEEVSNRHSRTYSDVLQTESHNNSVNHQLSFRDDPSREKVPRHNTPTNAVVTYNQVTRVEPKSISNIQPVSGAKGEEKTSQDPPPRHPGNSRAFGHYQCTCGCKWTSGNSWANETQQCKMCHTKVMPHKQEALKAPEEITIKKPHKQEFCSKCQKLNHLCTMTMELSKKNPEDIYIKGLPLDITEKKLIEMFRPYGPILRVHIPPKKASDEHPTRIAFITYQNPKIALQKFNAASVPVTNPSRSLRM